ncbi:unnamed protein product, partial [marine sediment metagenome]
AAEYVGKEYKGDFIAGVAGYYLDREGNHRLKVEGQEELENLFDKKSYLMDLTYDRYFVFLPVLAFLIIHIFHLFFQGITLHFDRIH